MVARRIQHPRHFEAVGPEAALVGQPQVGEFEGGAAGTGAGDAGHQPFEALQQRGDVRFRAALVLHIDNHPFHQQYFYFKTIRQLQQTIHKNQTMNSGPDITEKINDSTDTYLMRLYFTMLFLNISVNAIRNVERLLYGIRHLIPEDRHGLFTDAVSAEFLKLAQKKNLSKQDIQSIFDDTVIRFCICEYVEILTSCLEKAYRSYVLYLEMHKKSEKNQTRKLESVFHKSTLPRKVEILDSIGFFEKDSELKNYLQNIYDILVADEEFRVGEPTQAEGVDIGSMTDAAGAAQPAGTLQVR